MEAGRFVVYQVPFTSQAPFGDWRQPWQDFCEEATIVMAAHAFLKIPLSPRIAKEEMLLIKDIEELLFKRHLDTSIGEVALTLQLLYGIRGSELKTVESVGDIRRELRRGRILVVPTAGRLLHNPYFVPPGPKYHMIVVHGYDDTRGVFITNEPGTKHGANYEYKEEVLMNAIHDWNGGDVMRGERRILSVPI